MRLIQGNSTIGKSRRKEKPSGPWESSVVVHMIKKIREGKKRKRKQWLDYQTKIKDTSKTHRLPSKRIKRLPVIYNLSVPDPIICKRGQYLPRGGVLMRLTWDDARAKCSAQSRYSVNKTPLNRVIFTFCILLWKHFPVYYPAVDFKLLIARNGWSGCPARLHQHLASRGSSANVYCLELAEETASCLSRRMGSRPLPFSTVPGSHGPWTLRHLERYLPGKFWVWLYWNL